MAHDPAQLDAACAALKVYDWGGDANAFQSIDEAVIAAHDDSALRTDLERRFAALLNSDASRAAKEYVCRKLAMIGSAASAPVLAALLPHQDHSHMARFALERIDAPEAAAALRRALASLTGDLKIGMISSLGARGDHESIPALAALLGHEPPVAAAAAAALGLIASPQAAHALMAARPASNAAHAVDDARLACADALLASGRRDEARAMFSAMAVGAEKLPRSHRSRALRIAAQRGLLACADDTIAS